MQWSGPQDEIVHAVSGVASMTVEYVASTDRLGDVYSCDTFFEAPDSTRPGYATNAPGYTYTCQWPALDIHCEKYIICLLLLFL